MENTFRRRLLILILGLLTALSPFAIDLYLTSFPAIAKDLGATVPEVSLSLSAYFVGLSLGQLIYGPLLDRFGRKKPLYAGLVIFVLASVGCAYARSIEALLAFRALQALGGCAANVATLAIVRDLFSTRESARVLSLLVLILGVSPLLAPSLGGQLAARMGWPSVFFALAVIAVLLLLASIFLLRESHAGDTRVRLNAGAVVRGYVSVLREPQFFTYVLSGSVAFSGLFAYLAGSPILFMEIYGVSADGYGTIFALIAAGLIGASQVNVLLLRRYRNESIFRAALLCQVATGVALLAGTYFDLLGLPGTVGLFFLTLSCLGLMNPNASALALAPFSENAGSAAALLGFLQMGTGAIASMGVGLFGLARALPIVAIVSATSMVALLILLVGQRMIVREVEVPEGAAPGLGGH